MPRIASASACVPLEISDLAAAPLAPPSAFKNDSGQHTVRAFSFWEGSLDRFVSVDGFHAQSYTTLLVDFENFYSDGVTFS